MRKVQVWTQDGEVINTVMDGLDVVQALMDPKVQKVSFDLDDGFRLALYHDGTFQIFGGLVNYPVLDFKES